MFVLSFNFTMLIFQLINYRERPKLLIGLCYKPTSGRIIVRVIEGADIPVSAHRKSTFCHKALTLTSKVDIFKFSLKSVTNLTFLSYEDRKMVSHYYCI